MSDELKLLRAENDLLKATIANQNTAIAKLQFYIRGLLRGRFGRSTEKLLGIPEADQQLIVEIEDFLAAERAPAAEEAAIVPETAPAVAASEPAAILAVAAVKPAAKRGHRQRPSETFPQLDVRTREETLPEAGRLDGAGKPMVKIGDQVVETVVFTQGEVFIDRVVHARYRSVNESDAAGCATTAGVPVPERIVEGGMLADVTVHAVVIGKFADSLPANRTLEIMARAGCRLSGSVVDGAIAAMGDLLEPLAHEIRNDLRSAPVVGTDAAMMRCRDGNLLRKCRRTPIYTITDGM